MAVQGKLVPQDPSEEPAELLLERIRAEKQRLIQENKIKKEKNPSIIFRGADNLHYEKFSDGTVKCIKDEIPFELPKGWAWERLSNIASFSGGKTPSTTQAEYWGNEIPWVTSKDMKRKYITSSQLYLSTSGAAPLQSYFPNTLLLVVRSGILRHTLPVSILKTTATINQDLKAISLYLPELAEYIYICLKGLESHILRHYTKSGTTVQNINFDEFKNILLPIAPVQQMNKIISTIKELMQYIQQYDVAETQLLALKNKFPTSLRRSILQWAVQGKLVPQDESDEPAEILLERIREEKKRLVKEGKLKKDRHESIIFRRDNSYYEKMDGAERCIDDEIPFEIPKTWAWIRLGSILEIARGGSPRPIQEYLTIEEDGVNWIKIGDTDKSQKYIYSTKEKIKPSGISKSRMVYKGDFLLTNSMSFGHPYILQIDGCIHDGWLVLCDLFSCYHVDFLYYLLSSSFAYYQFCDSVSGAVVKNLNKDKVALAIFPLPPKHEQKRIAEQIETLFAILNR